ncbi:MAG: hypothetical protein HYZ75_09065 [Elusimicrobia bacterium]|nr:hypothetical protein [Elusimicrobiota bacterium]
MRRILPLILAASALSCRGTAPELYGPATLGYSAVLVRGRVIVPDGETRDAALWINLESPNERYRVRVRANETTLLRIEPDVYRLHPTRNPLGFVQANLHVKIAGRSYAVPFPRDILRKDPLEVKPTKVIALGVLEARLLPIKRGHEARVEVRLDDSNKARRHLIEDMIDRMMDAKASLEVRDAAVSWTRALEQALVLVQGEAERKATYKTPR